MRKRPPQRRHTAKNTPKQAIPDTPIDVQIKRLSHEGRGIARHEGKTLFVTGALPGETVSARLSKRHRRYDEADCINVITPAAERVEPICPHYGVCGGCDLQHLAHDQQIEQKQQIVLDQLARLGKVQPAQTDSPLRSKATGYRRSARLGINQLQRDGSVIIGFRRRGSSKLTSIDSCPVLENKLNQVLPLLREALVDYDNVRDITHAEVTLGDDQGALTLRTKKRPADALLNQLSQSIATLDLCLYLDNGQEVRAYNEDCKLSYALPEHKVDLAFRPGDFLQVNGDINQQMISRVLEWLNLNTDDRVLDLFSGIGNFTLPLARYADEVVGVEGIDAMVARATQNATNNGLENCLFYRANLSSDLRHHPWFNQGFSKILLDPPRAGAYEVIEQIGHYNAEQILYVSCNPAALARDAEKLVEMGYLFTRFCVMDMFPHTSHVESLALFEKKSDH